MLRGEREVVRAPQFRQRRFDLARADHPAKTRFRGAALRGIQRPWRVLDIPAQMLAENLDAMRVAIKFETVAEVIKHDAEALSALRLNEFAARLQRAVQRRRDPRPSIGAPPDH